MLLFPALVAWYQIQLITMDTASIQPDCSVCGLSGSSTMARIINGALVKPRFKYPWVVPIMFKEDSRFFTCTAAVITNQFILTAAHCFIDDEQKDKVCRTKGAASSCYMQPDGMNIGLMGASHKKPRLVMEIKRIIIHPDYDAQKSTDDIALVEMKHKIMCNKFINPICLPTKLPELEEGEQISIAGWGRFYQVQKTETQMLREGRVRYVDPAVCQAANSKQEDKSKIFCTKGLADGNQTSCQGDSGSSAFKSIDDAFYSLGVTSIHRDGGSCPVDGAVTYSNTFGYMDWIKSHVDNLPKPPQLDSSDTKTNNDTIANTGVAAAA